MKDYKKEDELLKSYRKLFSELKQVGIIRNKKDFTTQIGEWLVAEIFDGTFAVSSIQEGWDIKVEPDNFIQVKSHSKDSSNNARFSRVKKNPKSKVDELVVLVFSDDYKLQEFYKVPWNEARELVKERGKTVPVSELDWSDLINYKVDLKKLPKQNLVKLFL